MDAIWREQAKTTDWDDLPSELLQKVLHVAETQDDLAMVKGMRGVSKAWHAAFTGYMGAAVCRINLEIDFPRLRTILPCVSDLTLKVEDQDVPPASLVACTNVKSLSITDANEVYPVHVKDRLLVSLDSLPKNLVSLTLDSVRFVGSFGPNSLTKICLRLCYNAPSDVWEMLEGLPKLKELSLDWASQADVGSLDFPPATAFQSLSSLTKLAVLGGKSIVSVPIAYLPSTLLDLELKRVILDLGWPLFLASPTRLTQLKTTNCFILESSSQEAPHMAPIRSLKSMELTNSSSRLLGLAPSDLGSLSLDSQGGVALGMMSRLTAMTKLVLVNIGCGPRFAHYVNPLNLGTLQELSCKNCSFDLPILLVHAPMSALQSLHVGDKHSCLDLENSPTAVKLKRRLKEIMPSLMNLPALRQVSGFGPFWEIGLESVLQEWCVSEYMGNGLHSEAHAGQMRCMRKWSKPGLP